VNWATREFDFPSVIATAGIFAVLYLLLLIVCRSEWPAYKPAQLAEASEQLSDQPQPVSVRPAGFSVFPGQKAVLFDKFVVENYKGVAYVRAAEEVTP